MTRIGIRIRVPVGIQMKAIEKSEKRVIGAKFGKRARSVYTRVSL